MLSRGELKEFGRTSMKHYYHTNLAIEFSRDLFYVSGGQLYRITDENRVMMIEESEDFRRKVRGVKVGSLG